MLERKSLRDEDIVDYEFDKLEQQLALADKSENELDVLQRSRLQGLRTLRDKRKLRQNFNWREQAKPYQVMPPGDYHIWLLKGGRGSGKTRAGAEWCREMIFERGYRRGAVVAPTASDARDVCVEGPSGLLSVCPEHQRPEYFPSRRKLVFPNGATLQLFSADDPARFRGPQFEFLWADEISYYEKLNDVWETLLLGVRLGQRPLILATGTPLPLPLLKDLISRDGEDVAVTTGTTYQNLDNLAPTFRKQVLDNFEGTRRSRQEIMGELIFSVEGALWTSDMFRYVPDLETVPMLKRVGVGVDPSLTKNRRSDEAGIVVAGIDRDDLGYVLADKSAKMNPAQWARAAVKAYYTFEADFIVVETNQGGDMVVNTIRSIDPEIPVRKVSAYKGKVLRAEPVSARYEQGRVHHVPGLDQLEAEMCTYDGTGKSPNRLDACVYVLRELLVSTDSRFRWYVA